MPPLRLTSVLQTALPNLSQEGRALLSVLGCVNGHIPRSRELAVWLGFHDRYQLARALRREGLPPLEVMSGWARTLYWVLESETSGLSLRELAERERVDPAIAYRLVRRVTGRRWSEVRREGLATAVLGFTARCRRQPSDLAVRRDRIASAQATPPQPSRPINGSSRAPLSRVSAQPSSGSVSERVYMSGMPFDVTFTHDGRALVTRPHAALVDVLALDPLRVIGSIHVGATPTRVIASRVGPCAFVTTQFAETVEIIDVRRGRQIGAIGMPGHALGAALAPDGRTLFVVTNQDRLLAIAPARRTVVRSTAIPQACPHLAVHPSGRWVFVPCWRAGVVLEVDAHTLAVARRFEVGGVVQDVVVSADGQTVYVANEHGWLDAIHLPTGSRKRVPLGASAMGVGFSADNTCLFVSLFCDGRVVVLQRAGLRAGAVIVTGGRPQRFAAHPDGTVLVANDAGWVDSLREPSRLEQKGTA